MKKITLIIAFAGITLQALSQGLEVGLNGSLGTTWLLNKNVFDQDEILNPTFSGGFTFGASATYFFSPKLGVGIELNSATVNQKYSGEYSANDTYEAKTTLKYLSIPVLLKLQTESGFYFEIGPQFNSLSKAKEEYTSDPSDPDDYSSLNVKKGFENMVIAGVFGFGGRFDLNDNLALTAGVRFQYGIGDVTKEYSQTELLDLVTTGEGIYGEAGLT
ncbi:MAG TPA: porin family protein, partial [Bacteroidia bacterium]|nr:porin family protein [Bacteroidia bacterium]